MFFISILSVILSSYLFLSVININGNEKSSGTGFFYFVIIAFSQIVFSFEILSVLKAISQNGILFCNLVFLFFSLFLFYFKRCKFYLPKTDMKKIIKIINQDKILLFLTICFILFIIFQLITMSAFPIVDGDALVYYFTRATAWIQNKSILHYLTPDTREVIMPVNMDYLYCWLMMFTKSEMCAGIFSFSGYITILYIIYNLLKELKFSVKRRIWTIYSVSSFAILIMEMITPCSNIFIGALILGSIYLLIKAFKNSDNKALFFSSLSYALALGTKTTAIVTIPSVFFIFIILLFLYSKNKGKTFTIFSIFLIVNFLVFSSYNYILNFIEFSNPVSDPQQMMLHQFRGGLKGYLANIIKYSFSFFDLSGMPFFVNKINALIEACQNFVLSIFNLTIDDGATKYFPNRFIFHYKMRFLFSSLGVMGFLVLIPSLIYSIKRVIKHKTFSSIVLVLLGISLILNIMLFSRTIMFASYNIRYLLTFALIASPVIAYSYSRKKNFYKCFTALIMFMYLIVYPIQKPFLYFVECLIQNKIAKIDVLYEENSIYKYMSKKTPARIADITDNFSDPVYYIEKLRLKDFTINKILAENIQSYDLSQYDYIITYKNKIVASATIKDFENRIKNNNGYVSKCIYLDNEKNQINEYNHKIKPAMVRCEIPIDFIIRQGFSPDDEFKGEKYIILKRKK